VVDPSVRQAVRKAVRNGVSAEYARGEPAMAEFYRLHCKTRLRHGSPPPPYRFFESIHRHIIAPGKGWLVLARKDGEAIAGAVFLLHGERAIFKFGASDEEHLRLRPNNLVMWEAMVCLADAGMTSLDLGRTSMSNEGLRRFKLSLGGTERTIEYLRFDLRRNAYVTAPDRSSAAYNRYLGRLPAPLFRALGAAIYRHAA
jgi:lipid II:glycine glycyltransferase (peptidoglycan interpeptide bridge formation enzyme)